MTRVLTLAQKTAIKSELPSSFTIEGVAVTASKKWANQFIMEDTTTFPVITLNFPIMGGKNILNQINPAATEYYTTTLTIHILTKSTSTLNGAVMAEGIAQAVITEIESWALTPITGGAMIIFPRSDIKPVENHGMYPDPVNSVFDYIITVEISHT